MSAEHGLGIPGADSQNDALPSKRNTPHLPGDTPHRSVSMTPHTKERDVMMRFLLCVLTVMLGGSAERASSTCPGLSGARVVRQPMAWSLDAVVKTMAATSAW